jgi:tight adherence protein C
MPVAWLISLLTGGALFLACARVEAARRTIIGWLAPEPAVSRPGIARYEAFAAGLGRSRVVRRVGRTERAARRLQFAGDPFSLDVLVGLQVAAGAACAAWVLSIGLMWSPGLLLIPLAIAAGVRAPEVALARRARRRQARIAASVPDLVELLLATTEAGLSPAVALGRTADVLRGPLGDEVRTTVREVELGGRWQAAMEHLVDRTDVPALRSVALTLTRSQRLGSPLGLTLRRLVADLRRDRRVRAEETARKAPIKMLFPLVFLILPAFLLLTVGPVVLATIRSLH